MRGKITRLNQSLSALWSIDIQTQKGFETIHGDWRCIRQIIEDLGIGADVEIIKEDGQTYIRPIEWWLE